MEAESIPLDKITYKLYGITQNSQQVELYTGTLTSDGNWKEVVPSEYLKDEYVSYRVEEYLEDLTAENYNCMDIKSVVRVYQTETLVSLPLPIKTIRLQKLKLMLKRNGETETNCINWIVLR